jgi:two-component system cell cycle sensor histidine kinase/response regulator CckA
VAHDFNNALLIIQANADLARLRPSYAETALQAISEAIHQAAATTRQLRAFSPQAQQPPRVVSLGDTLEREVQLLKWILPANIALRYEEPSAEVTVLGDEGQIQSLLTNFALNARDAMPEGGTLEMRLRSATPDERDDSAQDGDDFAVIAIEDTGVGMSPETTARIFEPFFTTKGAAGTGLGLASVRAIVERAGGRIEVESAIGRGTRFRIFWPIHRAENARRSSAVPEDDEAGSGTVLVVDDDDEVRRAMVKPLAWRGYTVLEARTGADALLVARRHHERIDVLCVDLIMPGMPTRQLVESFRAAHPDVRVLLCSGYLPEEAGRPLDVVDAFLPKPFSPSALARVVRRLVTRAKTDERAVHGKASTPVEE